MMISEEHLYSIALRKCFHIGDVSFQKIILEAGSAEYVWKNPKKIFGKIRGLGQKKFLEIGKKIYLDFAESEIKFCEKNNIIIRLRHLDELPFFLSECADAPSVLYQQGKVDETLFPLSIVGTRKITAYGKDFVEKLLSDLSENKILTVSGLAYGVDGEVHEKSLEKDIPTVAVLAHGFHTMYPAKHRKLADKILQNNGALFTEFNSSDGPDREHFLQRNRIIAGLSRHLIVVETAFGGGSISTASYANSYNREVYALPGKITDKYSQGCNHLIFQNKAAAISTVKSLIDDLGLEKQKLPELFPRSEYKIQLPEEQRTIYEIIKNQENISLDEISEQIGWPTFKILPILLELEISYYIQSFSGRRFSVL